MKDNIDIKLGAIVLLIYISIYGLWEILARAVDLYIKYFM